MYITTRSAFAVASTIAPPRKLRHEVEGFAPVSTLSNFCWCYGERWPNESWYDLEKSGLRKSVGECVLPPEGALPPYASVSPGDEVGDLNTAVFRRAHELDASGLNREFPTPP